MAQKQRRTDEELVKALLSFLDSKGKFISRGELCRALGISTETAEKWLKIGLMFQNECPPYDYDKADSSNIGLIKIKEQATT